MTLLNGLLGFFTVLGSVPIIIHLLNRRRFKIVMWAAMEFLLATIEKNSRRVQLRDLILMLLRTGVIVFLALALARPTLAPGGIMFEAFGESGAPSAVVVLDNSLSMGLTSGAETRFDVAKRAAREIVSHMPKGSKVGFILLSDIADDAIPEPSQDLDYVLSQIDQAQLCDGGSDVFQGIEGAWAMLKKQAAVGREIHLLTDVQAGGWPAQDDAAWRKLQGEMKDSRPPSSLYVIAVDEGRRENLGIVSFAPEDELVTTESDVAFIVVLRNSGNTPMTNVPVDLLVGAPGESELRKAASVVIDEVVGTREVRLETRFAEGGPHRIAVEAGVDTLAADNRRFLSVDVLDALRVLIVDGAPGRNEDPFSGETGFLNAALSPEKQRLDDRAAIITEVTTVPGLRGKTLRDYHAVILANVGELPPGLVEGLKTFVGTEGKGLLIFLGDQVQADRYNRILYDEAGLLPGPLGELIVAEDKEHAFGFSTDALSHPIVNFFMHPEAKRYLSQPRFTKAFALTLPEPEEAPEEKTKPERDEADADGEAENAVEDYDPQRKGSHVVARFVGGQIAIAERKVGRGTVLCFASSADRDWNDMPLHPAYLMLLRRATQHVTQGPKPSSTVQTHAPIALDVGVKEAGKQIQLVDPRGRQRELTALVASDNRSARVQYADTAIAGFYRMTRSDEAGASSWFAVNTPRSESELAAFDEGDLRQRYPELDFRWIDGRGAIGALLSEKRIGKEIWPWLFALAACCLLAEWLLAMIWAPKEV